MSDLKYLSVEISYGSQWIDLNDQQRFKISSDGTRDSSARSWRKITAESPFLGGNYLIHATPDMVQETLALWVFGQDQSDLSDNVIFAEDLFTQFDYRIRWTTNEYREYWRCQLADAQVSRNSTWTHNTMAAMSFSIPRYPDVSRERIA